MNMQNHSPVKGFRQLNHLEIELVSGGYLYEEMDDEELRMRMALQDMTILQKAAMLDALVDGGFFPSPMSSGSSGFEPYQPGKDYCTRVSDTIDGIDISYACYLHDMNYSQGSTMSRSEADWRFAMDIVRILTANGMDSRAAGDWALIYHTGVRFFGIAFYEGQGANN